MVFYRKYRPATIEELDSKTVREKLTASLSGKNVSHAFLFTGPKGLGKTSTARIVAKIVNCEKRKKIDPCNKCDQCISITNGTNIDVLEIDGASNRGIDEIRDLREKIRLSPARASKKVYIIDEVHMLTTEAFNALLKTLEEPPSHALFILCTTEPHKVPPTIISRCLHIAFRKATGEELVRSFERIVKGEKLNADKEALVEIANLSDGSFRDGVKILEEMVGIADRKKITRELVEKKYQVISIKHQVSQLIGFLQKKDAKEGLDLISKLVEQGVDMKYFVEQLINHLHLMLLARLGIEKSEELTIDNEDLGLTEIKNLVELLGRAHGEIKYAVLPQLPLELVMIEWGIQGSEEKPTKNQTVFSSPASGLSRSKSTTDGIWYQLIDKVKTYDHSVAGVLRGCKMKNFDDKNLVIEARFKFHKERLDDQKAREIIHKAAKDISGKDVEVQVILKG